MYPVHPHFLFLLSRFDLRSRGTNKLALPQLLHFGGRT